MDDSTRSLESRSGWSLCSSPDQGGWTPDSPSILLLLSCARSNLSLRRSSLVVKGLGNDEGEIIFVLASYLKGRMSELHVGPLDPPPFTHPYWLLLKFTLALFSPSSVHRRIILSCEGGVCVCGVFVGFWAVQLPASFHLPRSLYLSSVWWCLICCWFKPGYFPFPFSPNLFLEI